MAMSPDEAVAILGGSEHDARLIARYRRHLANGDKQRAEGVLDQILFHYRLRTEDGALEAVYQGGPEDDPGYDYGWDGYRGRAQGHYLGCPLLRREGECTCQE